MVVERIERGEKWWTICYGYGKLQKARHIYASSLPESVKRNQITNPDASDEEILSKMTQDEITSYNQNVGIEIVGLVLHGAHDLENGGDIAEYVDESLPEDVGLEILSRVREALTKSQIPAESKKN